MNLKFYALSILAIVSISLCTIPEIPGVTPGVVGAAGRGLEIISFTSEPSPVFSRGTARVIMETENQGGSTVNNDSAIVYLTGSNINLGSTTGDYWFGSGAEDKKEIRRFPKNMAPEDVVKGTPASTYRFVWNLVAPNLTAGQTRNDMFIGRIYHEYTSAANGNIWVYSDTESEAARAAGRPLNKASFTSTAGPVAVEVTVTPDPIILYGSESTFSFNIKISNVAAGTIYKNDTLSYSTITSGSGINLKSEDLNKVFVEVKIPTGSGLTVTDCTGEQELVSSKSMTLVCTVTGASVSTFKSYAINVIAHYGYYTEKTASVTVQGR